VRKLPIIILTREGAGIEIVEKVAVSGQQIKKLLEADLQAE